MPSLKKPTKFGRTPYFFSCYCNIFLLFIIVSEEECYNVVFEAAFTWQQRTKDAYKHRQKNNFIHNLIFRTKIKPTKFTTDFFLYSCWNIFKDSFPRELCSLIKANTLQRTEYKAISNTTYEDRSEVERWSWLSSSVKCGVFSSQNNYITF